MTSSDVIDEFMDEFGLKSALIIGGSTKIGLQCAKDVVKGGIMKLAVFDEDPENSDMKQFSENANVEFFMVKCDFTSPESIEIAFIKASRQFRCLNLIINCIPDENVINKCSLIGITNIKAGCAYSNGGTIININRLNRLTYSYIDPSSTDCNKYNIRLITICPEISLNIERESAKRIENVSIGILHAILHGENGSIWVTDGERLPYTIKLPQLHDAENTIL